ncbi:MAG: ATP-dependent carboxylate-amine ligase, partial [Gammaproteobacteria bacterium]
IEDQEGDFWFLECNSEGQWYWLDKAIGGIISDTFAEVLANLACS